MFKWIVLIFILLGFNPAWSVVNGELVNNDNQDFAVFPLIVTRYPLLGFNTFTATEITQQEICTGVAISHSELITAGHCLRSDDGKPLFVSLAHWNHAQNVYNLIHPDTHFVFFDHREDRPVNPGAICPKYPFILPNAHFADLAIIKFRPHTFSKWHQISRRRDILKVGAEIKFYGYGITENPFFGNPRLMMNRGRPVLRGGSARLWKLVQRRIGWLSFLHEPFAADGDSGGPVFYQGQLIGIINSVSEYCSDETGSDYAILNTVSLLSVPPKLLDQ